MNYERLVGAGLGPWDFRTADHLHRSVALRVELVGRLVTLPDQLVAQVPPDVEPAKRLRVGLISLAKPSHALSCPKLNDIHSSITVAPVTRIVRGLVRGVRSQWHRQVTSTWASARRTS